MTNDTAITSRSAADPRATPLGGRAWLVAAFAMTTVGWGANQFAPLLSLYETQRGVSTAQAQGMFVLYAVGLVPGLLAGGPLSDRRGRRQLMLAALALSMVAGIVLAAGAWTTTVLYAGRLIAGVASGAAFSCGTAWIGELSARRPGAAGRVPRRATVAMTAGFGLGPLAAGMLAQYAPAPLVLVYVPHVLLAATALVLAWRAPSGPATGPVAATPRPVAPAWRHRRFVLLVLPVAPWVFLTAAVALATLPGSVADLLGDHVMLFSGLVTPLPALTGVLVQPVARRLHNRSRLLNPGSLALAVIGLLIGAAAVATSSIALVVVGALVLGAAYGALMVSGLTEVQRLAEPAHLGRAIAIFQAATYAGYLSPFFIALLARVADLAHILVALAVLAAATAVWAAAADRRLARGAAR
ncbi:MFS transporter [Amycolatopsis granulosa]|uniref:MFS transporter n=1 Tax=Amycolatopsis granulosa TaxID=185684 RepID=UPI001420C2D2|nr:MFS transporter [Amycolatopsis granulosa]NIH83445.1 MFS family permease [Amycolatopsis granulosa]